MLVSRVGGPAPAMASTGRGRASGAGARVQNRARTQTPSLECAGSAAEILVVEIGLFNAAVRQQEIVARRSHFSRDGGDPHLYRLWRVTYSAAAAKRTRRKSRGSRNWK